MVDRCYLDVTLSSATDDVNSKKTVVPISMPCFKEEASAARRPRVVAPVSRRRRRLLRTDRQSSVRITDRTTIAVQLTQV